MTDSRTKEPLGETCKAHLLECWIAETYDRHKDIKNKYITKGLEVEEDSITLYSRARKKLLIKNEETLSNEFIVGTPDLIHENSVVDIKSSWDIFTFYGVMHKPLNKDYGWQISAYCELLQKESGLLAYCLVNTPEQLINDAKRKLAWDMGVIDPDANELYQQGCERLEKEMIFDDIPFEKRYIEFAIVRTDFPMEKAYQRVKECREFMNALG
jgi:hypothetical protein